MNDAISCHSAVKKPHFYSYPFVNECLNDVFVK